MFRVFRIACLSVLVLIGFALAPSMLPRSETSKHSGSALAQKAENDAGPFLDDDELVRLRKHRTRGPGLKVLKKDAAAACIDCHKGHKQPSVKRSMLRKKMN